MLAILIS